MLRHSIKAAVGWLVALSLGGMGWAQGYLPAGGGAAGTWARLEGGGTVNEDTVRTARETLLHSVPLPDWTNPLGFENDVFTFTRVIFRSDASKPVERGGGGGGGFGRGFRGGGGGGFSGGGGGRGGLGWAVDYPDADLNLSYRLQQLTSLRMDPDARVLKLTNPDLAHYPFIYMEHIERLTFSADEVPILRAYLSNGGFLLVNDFWGALAWNNFTSEMNRVLPGRRWTELTLDHPIFHSVFDLRGPMNNLRVPTMQMWDPGADPADPASILIPRYRGEGYETMHVYGLTDEKGRLISVAIHNSDVSDGWERDGENVDYFEAFSEKRAYPLGLNIITYLLTH